MRTHLLIIIGTLLYSSSIGQNTKLSPQEFSNQIFSNPAKTILDVRTKEEFNAGYIDHAVNIDWNENTFESKTEKLDKFSSIYVYCLSGGRSGNAAKNLRARGFKKIIELDGGIMAWKSEKLPLVTESSILKTDMTKTDFENLYHGKTKKVLIDFYASWCGPCRKMKPVLDELEKSESNTLEIIRINADDYPQLSEELGIKALPTFLLFQQDKLLWKRIGYIEKSELKSLLSK